MLEVGVFTGVATLGLAISVTAAAAAAQRASGQAPPVVVGLELEPSLRASCCALGGTKGARHHVDLVTAEALSTPEDGAGIVTPMDRLHDRNHRGKTASERGPNPLSSSLEDAQRC